MKNRIQPVLIGADLNCYNVARAFHEAYDVKSVAFGRYEIGATKNSNIIDFNIEEGLNNPEKFIDVLMNFADINKGKHLILIGCTDEYAELIIDNKDILGEKYIVPYIGRKLKEELISKDSFYEICEKFKLPYPKTYIYSKNDKLENIDIKYPMIVKPADSISYWHNPFENMKKAYLVNNINEFRETVDSIYNSGYNQNLIIQDFIPGDDSKMRVLTSYSDKSGNVKMMCLGHVLLEEHTPKGIGNHAAIITEYNEDIMLKIKSFLESINYTGFSNFDIKYDERDKQYKIFEINLRQGRSNYYVTGAQKNIAKYVVEDYILNKDMDLDLCKEEYFWRVIPDKVVYKFVKDKDLINKAKTLVKENKCSSSFEYDKDLTKNLKRKLYLKLFNINQMRKFKKYCK